MTTNPSFLARQSTARIGLVALGLIFLSLLIAAYPTITFVRGFTTETLHPVAQFESGDRFEFIDPDPYSGYLLSMTVTQRDAPLPPMEISVINASGQVTGDPINRWNSVMGREYKQFLRIPSQPDGKLTITIDTPENENFLIFRTITDVVTKARSKAMPLWITALVPLTVAVFLLGVILVRAVNSSSSVNLHVSE